VREMNCYDFFFFILLPSSTLHTLTHNDLQQEAGEREIMEVIEKKEIKIFIMPTSLIVSIKQKEENSSSERGREPTRALYFFEVRK
jgi:hypothetical protein